MSFTIESLTSRPVSLTPPKLILPNINKRKPKKLNRVTFRLTPQIRFKERTPSDLSNHSSLGGYKIDFKEIILESELISFEKAMDLVRKRAAEDEKRLVSASSTSIKSNKSESNLKQMKPLKNINSRNRSPTKSPATSSRLSSSRIRLNENEELKKLNEKIKLKEEKRLRELEEENRKRAEREAFLEKERLNKIIMQKKLEEDKKKKEILEKNRIQEELEKEKKEQLEKLKKVAEVKIRNRAQMEARLSNQMYNIDYTRDRKEIKIKKANKKIKDIEKEERLAAEKEAKRLAKIREKADKEREKELERQRYEQLKQDKLMLLSTRFLSKNFF